VTENRKETEVVGDYRQLGCQGEESGGGNQRGETIKKKGDGGVHKHRWGGNLSESESKAGRNNQ